MVYWINSLMYWINSLMYWINSLMYWIHPGSSPNPYPNSEFSPNTYSNPTVGRSYRRQFNMGDLRSLSNVLRSKKKNSDHIHLFVSAKGRKLYGSKCFFHLPARVNRGQRWVVANFAGLVRWKIKTYSLNVQIVQLNSGLTVYLSGFSEILSGFIYTNFFFLVGLLSTIGPSDCNPNPHPNPNL